MPITHTFVSAKSDGGDATLVRPSDWNASHTGGTVATDAIWDAAGDLAVGTGADTAAKLTKGAAGTVPTAGASTLAYAFPPGYELDLTEVTSSVTVTSTSSGTPTAVVSGASVTYDGTPVIVEFSCTYLYVSTDTAGKGIVLGLYVDGTLVRLLGYTDNTSTTDFYAGPVTSRTRYTPSAGAHTIAVSAYKDAGGTTSVLVAGGNGASGAAQPILLRVLKA